jgi:hypothetical protein
LGWALYSTWCLEAPYDDREAQVDQKPRSETMSQSSLGKGPGEMEQVCQKNINVYIYYINKYIYIGI